MKTSYKIAISFLLVFILAQAFRSEKNNSNDLTKQISTLYPVPTEVKTILAKACNDCHSNLTQYPWYAEVQPISAWVANHVKDGKKHLNFDEFANYSIAKQYKKLEECAEQVSDGEMPLPSYTNIHKEAILSKAEKQVLTNWTDSIRAKIKSSYPTDSLVLKKRSAKKAEEKH